MNLTLDRKPLIKFLSQVSKLSEKCSINIEEDNLNLLTNNETGSIILYGKLDSKIDLKEKNKKLNLPNITKFVRVLDCIDEDQIKLTFESNSINHKGDIKFKYHLLEDSALEGPIINVEKMNKLVFNSEYNISYAKVNEFLKGSAFISEIEKPKIYLYTKDKKVYGELADKVLQNTDSITFCISDSFTGASINEPLPVELQAFRMFAGLKFDHLNIKVNSKLKILMISIIENDLTLKYLVSALVK